MVSLTTKWNLRLRLLQFAMIGNEHCFMDRVVSVCYDNTTDGFGSCVVSPFRVPPSDFRRGNYANLIWAKWHVIGDALSASRFALWLDADVLIFRNPWPSISLSVPSGQQVATAFDIQHQAEKMCHAQACHAALERPECALNGGQLLVSNASLAWDIWNSRPSNLSNYGALDQDFASKVIKEKGYSSCMLPPANFGSVCHDVAKGNADGRRRRGPMLKRSCTLATYHVSCLVGRGAKQIASKDLLNTFQSFSDSNCSTAESTSAFARSLEHLGKLGR